jgi:hypothetical protein
MNAQIIEQANQMVSSYIARKMNEGCDCITCSLSRVGWEDYEREWAEKEAQRRAAESAAGNGQLGRYSRSA